MFWVLVCTLDSLFNKQLPFKTTPRRRRRRRQRQCYIGNYSSTSGILVVTVSATVEQFAKSPKDLYYRSNKVGDLNKKTTYNNNNNKDNKLYIYFRKGKVKWKRKNKRKGEHLNHPACSIVTTYFLPAHHLVMMVRTMMRH